MMSRLEDLKNRLGWLKAIMVGIVVTFSFCVGFYKKASRRVRIVILVTVSCLIVVSSFLIKDYVDTKEEIARIISIQLIVSPPK